jgi:hypothetical protein
MKVLVVYHSIYGHVLQLAKAVEEGVKSVSGVEAVFRRAPESLFETRVGILQVVRFLKPRAAPLLRKFVEAVVPTACDFPWVLDTSAPTTPTYLR